MLLHRRCSAFVREAKAASVAIALAMSSVATDMTGARAWPALSPPQSISFGARNGMQRRCEDADELVLKQLQGSTALPCCVSSVGGIAWSVRRGVVGRIPLRKMGPFSADLRRGISQWIVSCGFLRLFPRFLVLASDFRHRLLPIRSRHLAAGPRRLLYGFLYVGRHLGVCRADLDCARCDEYWSHCTADCFE